MTAMRMPAWPGQGQERAGRRRSLPGRVLADPRGRIGAVGVVVIVVVALLAPLAPHGPFAQDASGRLLAPSWEHPFGTDELRRDLLARTAYGLRLSLAVSIAAVLAGATAGTAFGFVAGYAGRRVDAALMRLIDAWMAFPALLTALAILTILGPGMRNVGIALAVFNVPVFARMARAQMLVERRREYVVAAGALGAHPARVIARHIAPNALPPLVTHLALAMTGAIMVAAALSFLGLGERAPEPSLGSLISASRTHLRDAWWYAAFPGGVLTALLLSFTLLADATNDALGAGAGGR